LGDRAGARAREDVSTTEALRARREEGIAIDGEAVVRNVRGSKLTADQRAKIALRATKSWRSGLRRRKRTTAEIQAAGWEGKPTSVVGSPRRLRLQDYDLDEQGERLVRRRETLPERRGFWVIAGGSSAFVISTQADRRRGGEAQAAAADEGSGDLTGRSGRSRAPELHEAVRRAETRAPAKRRSKRAPGVAAALLRMGCTYEDCALYMRELLARYRRGRFERPPHTEQVKARIAVASRQKARSQPRDRSSGRFAA
jgi:hypothetical protein